MTPAYRCTRHLYYALCLHALCRYSVITISEFTCISKSYKATSTKITLETTHSCYVEI